MNRKELIDALAAKTDSTKVDAERSIAALLDIISTTLKKGDSLSLVGFGTFEVRKRAARTGRNPKTGEELKIKASKVPAFKPGATLKGLVNGVKKYSACEAAGLSPLRFCSRKKARCCGLFLRLPPMLGARATLTA